VIELGTLGLKKKTKINLLRKIRVIILTRIGILVVGKIKDLGRIA
jgi:hypothetical protein